WAMLAFGLLCILAGVAIADLGPRLFAAKSTPKAPAEAASTVEPPASAAAPPTPTPAATPEAPSPDVERLSARVTTLESQQAHTSQAAAAALAVSAVVEASQGA